ncbi:helix-turn-helix domain-containing protein [Paenibacillus thalictri]|uniref:XRE family transcriptional regulator n=1 Tax=Paenibacillus thalictri TaxID=2527873 RepID=A0A4Q9DMV2_9BACL|nr:helix-turn-helix transcriptional regulator [Paenibacillus thalictri]TBL77258.1 XRE family transcriptional regulator [Paenibacillus thalictri]
MNVIGRQLQRIRQHKGIGLNEFARELGVSPVYLSNLETGRTQTIQLEVLHKLENELLEAADAGLPDTMYEAPVELRIDELAARLKRLAVVDVAAAEFLLNTAEQGIAFWVRRE